MTDGHREIVLISKKGNSIRFNEEEVRATGRSSMGVTGMRFAVPDDEVVTIALDIQGEDILFATENGMGKRTSFSEFKAQHRGGKGVRCYKVTEKTGELVAGCAVDPGDQIMLITNQGIVMRMSVDDISVIGRNTSGVKLMNVSQSEEIKLTGMARIWSGFLTEENADAAQDVESDEALLDEDTAEDTADDEGTEE